MGSPASGVLRGRLAPANLLAGLRGFSVGE